jgi:hypothetical protein
MPLPCVVQALKEAGGFVLHTHQGWQMLAGKKISMDYAYEDKDMSYSQINSLAKPVKDKNNQDDKNNYRHCG